MVTTNPNQLCNAPDELLDETENDYFKTFDSDSSSSSDNKIANYRLLIYCNHELNVIQKMHD